MARWSQLLCALCAGFLFGFQKAATFLGRIIGRCSLAVAFCSWLLTCVCLSLTVLFGQRFVVYNKNVTDLFVPQRAKSFAEKDKVTTFFPTNFSDFVQGHETLVESVLNVYIFEETANATVFDPDLWSFATKIDEDLSNEVNITHKGNVFNFPDLCAKRNGECSSDNEFLGVLANSLPYIINGSVGISYPLFKFAPAGIRLFLPASLGGATVENALITNANVMRLSYILDSSSEKRNFSELWELEALRYLKDEVNNTRFQMLAIASPSLGEELAQNIGTSIDFRYVGSSVFLVLVYVIAISYTRGSLADVAVVLVGLANTGACILLSVMLYLLLGFEWQSVNYAGIFLLLGVGLDDTFVLTSIWKHVLLENNQNGRHGSPEKLMGECYKEAIVSISLTTFTNVISFAVGVISEFKTVELFCVFAILGLLLIYATTLVQVGATMASIHRLFNPSVEANDYRTGLSDGLARILCNFKVKVGICTIWISYAVIMAVIMLLFTTEGLERKKLGRYDSEVTRVFKLEDRAFRGFPYRIQVVIAEPLDYSNVTVRETLDRYLARIREHRLISNYTEIEENWLEAYFKSPFYDVTQEGDPREFNHGVKTFLNKLSHTKVTDNVKWDEVTETVLASRW